MNASAWLRPSLCLGAALLGGCAIVGGPKADPTRFYTLTAPAAAATDAPSPAAGARLLVRRVELPGHLQAKVFAVRAAGGSIEYANTQWWSEPLDLAIGRVVRETLSQAGFAASARRDAAYDFEVVIRLTRFEGERGEGASAVRLAATVEFLEAATGRRVDARRTSFEGNWDGADFAALAATLGRQAADLGRFIAANAPRR